VLRTRSPRFFSRPVRTRTIDAIDSVNGGATVPADKTDPTTVAKSWVPAAGGTNVVFVTFPPDSVMMTPTFDPVAAGGEYMQVQPGLAEKFEMDNPGMHTTDTVDYGVLIDGEVHLELDDGATKKLAPRDIVVQNGTRHAWRNKSTRPATMLFVLVGAKRK
jgi:hypothetical protein